jgi:pyrroline-5-carboxylate reductase
MTYSKDEITIGIIGIGNMGESILKGISEKFNTKNIFINDTFTEKVISASERYNVNQKNKEWILGNCDVIIIAIKPQDFNKLTEKTEIKKDAILISIMAGIKIKQISETTKHNKIVRVMPNLCAKILKSTSTYTCNASVEIKDKELIKDILNSFGESIEIKEDEMDITTAAAGSGPAFISYLIDCFIEASFNEGLDKDKARKLCLETFNSTSKLLLQENIMPNDLIKAVCSKGGTTFAGMSVLESSDIREIIHNTIKKAKERSIEMSNNN